jgi:hypothetical protein
VAPLLLHQVVATSVSVTDLAQVHRQEAIACQEVERQDQELVELGQELEYSQSLVNSEEVADCCQPVVVGSVAQDRAVHLFCHRHEQASDWHPQCLHFASSTRQALNWGHSQSDRQEDAHSRSRCHGSHSHQCSSHRAHAIVQAQPATLRFHHPHSLRCQGH